MAKLTKNLAPLFDSSISYEPGERFMYGDHMYEALEPLSGAFDLTKVSEVTLADIFKGVASNDVKCLAPEYDEATEYYTENLVMYKGVLYECIESTTGPFDETKWSRKYLSDVSGLNSNLVKELPSLVVSSSSKGSYPAAHMVVDTSKLSEITIGSLTLDSGMSMNVVGIRDTSNNWIWQTNSVFTTSQTIDVSAYDNIQLYASGYVTASYSVKMTVGDISVK